MNDKDRIAELEHQVAELDAENAKIYAMLESAVTLLETEGGTVEGEKRRIIAEVEAGRITSCRSCTQLAKIYPRRLNSEMARFLIALVKRYELTKTWVHVRDLMTTTTVVGESDKFEGVQWAGTNGTLLKHWGFLIHRPKDPENKKIKTSGFWMPTQDGIDFVYNRKTVPSHAHLYKKKRVGWSTEQTSIIDSLGEDFDYAELMAQETLTL